jgi:phage terminase large subunit-like protein
MAKEDVNMLTLREKQKPPQGDWETWMILAGRGWGKTTAGAHWCRQMALENPGCRVVAIGNGVINSFREACGKPALESRIVKLRHRFENGSEVLVISPELYEYLRGKSFEFAWADDPQHWRNDEAFPALLETLREPPARICVTMTPSPEHLASDLVADRMKDPGIVITYGHSRENAANLAPGFVDDLERLMASKSERVRLDAAQEVLARGVASRCECGARACGSRIHSDWCPAGR